MQPSKLLFIALLFTVGVSVRSNAQAIVGRVYVTIADVVTVFGVDSLGNMDSTARYSVSNKTKFSVVGFDKNNNIKITFWRYPWSFRKPASERVGNLTDSTRERRPIFFRDTIQKQYYWSYPDTHEFVGPWANFKQFVIAPTVFNAACKEYYGAKKEFTWGVMTLPIKVRFGNGGNSYFDFEERLNLGFALGLRQQLKGYVVHSLNYLGGFGITSAKTDSNSIKDASFYDGPNTLALSFHVGTLYQHEDFQAGIFIGTDFIPGPLGRQWKRQGKPWIGLALGVSLFSKSNPQGGGGENTH